MIGSAYWIAAARARESAREDRLFDDPWAAVLAGERGFASMAASERVTGGENPFLPVRTRYFDDAITGALDAGIRQVVLLGAGLDTRPFRMALPAGVTWYELDRPEIFVTKEPVLANVPARCARSLVPCDLTEDWAHALRATGYEADRRTLWVGEGLLFYLTPQEVSAVLSATAAESAPGSRFLADVMPSSVAEIRPGSYGHDDPAVLLAANGWEIERLTHAGAPDANYGRFVAQARPMPAHRGRAHLVTGRRPAPNAG